MLTRKRASVSCQPILHFIATRQNYEISGAERERLSRTHMRAASIGFLSDQFPQHMVHKTGVIIEDERHASLRHISMTFLAKCQCQGRLSR